MGDAGARGNVDAKKLGHTPHAGEAQGTRGGYHLDPRGLGLIMRIQMQGPRGRAWTALLRRSQARLREPGRAHC